MNRRTFLAGVAATAGAVVTAGCTENIEALGEEESTLEVQEQSIDTDSQYGITVTAIVGNTDDTSSEETVFAQLNIIDGDSYLVSQDVLVPPETSNTYKLHFEDEEISQPLYEDEYEFTAWVE